jgi:hypothetical protein
MLKKFNNFWIIIIAIILFYFIIKKLYNLNTPIDIDNLIKKNENENKDKINKIPMIIMNMPTLLGYFFGII